MNDTDRMQAEQSAQEHDYCTADKMREWCPVPFEQMLWHELIARVNAGTATFEDAQHVRHHLGLDHEGSRIQANGGDAETADSIRVNLGFMRVRSLRQFGFREVNRVDEWRVRSLANKLTTEKTMQAKTRNLRTIAKGLKDSGMGCNCDLNNWEPTKTSGHSYVCRIHKMAIEIKYGRVNQQTENES